MGFKPIDADLIVGKWQEETNIRTIEIYKKGGLFYGKILENKHAEEDGLEPGVEMMQGFAYDEENENWRGEVVLPKKDMRIKTRLSIKDNNLISEASVLFVKKRKLWQKLP